MMSAGEVKRRVASRDYAAIARTFSDSVDAVADVPSEHGPVRALANRLAYTLKADNPRFDTVRFLAACGIQRLPG